MYQLLYLLILGLFASSATASELRVVIDKSDRDLSVYRQDTKIHGFRIGLGGSPVRDKEQSGDSRTPEGVFYICVKNLKSRFYLSLGISYPDTEDAERGLRDGLITQAEHDKIIAAQKRKVTPPWNTKLGGEIFIHGCGSSSDWTLGCIALNDQDMKLLYDIIEVGTKVEINP